MQGIDIPKEPLTIESLQDAIDAAIRESAPCRERWAEEFVPIWRALIQRVAPLYSSSTPEE